MEMSLNLYRSGYAVRSLGAKIGKWAVQLSYFLHEQFAHDSDWPV